MPSNVVIDIEDKRPHAGGGGGLGLIGWMFALLVLLGSARSIATFYIDWSWWNELGQGETWAQMLRFAILPRLAVSLITGIVFFAADRLLAPANRTGRRWWLRLLAYLVGSYLLTAALIDNWTLVRFWGGSAAASQGSWRDPVFGNDLGFYFFGLPFYQMLLRWLMVLALAGGLLFIVRTKLGALQDRFDDLRGQQWSDLQDLRLGQIFGGPAFRVIAALLLVIFAGLTYLARYGFLFEDHGFLVGADYVAIHYGVPLVWAKAGACILAAALVVAGRWLWAGGLLVLVWLVAGVVPIAVNALQVRPNEISLQRPHIMEHIGATRSAFGLGNRLKERDFPARQTGAFDPTAHKSLLENVRLWDWKAFHDTVTQIQALRPYYVFQDTDVDRYRSADGEMRQVLLTPRELDVRQLPEARTRWINPHFIYTHGYGVVMAEANKITADGLPQLMIKDAPLTAVAGAPTVKRPEIYYGEIVHEPVFVRTAQPEFNYPSGTENVHSKYEGAGGIPIDGFLMRLAAAIAEGDWNILLTSYLSPESRMLIRRNIVKRVDEMAEFVIWDEDPYLVISKEGRLVWMIDGYTAHNRHPYSKSIRSGFGNFNYIRNTVKATVDAYDGHVTLYAWDDTDPVLSAYRNIFPKLFKPASEMPADLREHARYPEFLFRVQAEIYLTYHMKDPEAFYNKEDIWDIAKTGTAAEVASEAAKPTYLVATLPGDKKAEFMMLTTFTPRNKQNLIGLMAARCDGDRLGEVEVLQLSKQQLIYGPMQISARINQDQNISKDLTLWNQQGSSVIKGQMLVLPMADQFLYVEPIYIQAAKAPMPELKKVALGFGSNIAYADTYEQALDQLAGRTAGLDTPVPTEPGVAGAPPTAAPRLTQTNMPSGDARIERARGHLRKYRELSSQGRFVDAARELEAMDAALKP